jgi:hypothetical protein
MLSSYKTPDAPWHHSRQTAGLIHSLNHETCTQKNEEPIKETISDIKIGLPVSRWFVTLLLEPWPDLHRDAMEREEMGWINLLQAAAARLERVSEWVLPRFRCTRMAGRG